MSREKMNSEAPIRPQNECYALLPAHCQRAMMYLILGEEGNYLREITEIAQISSDLLNYYAETPQSLIRQMENTMAQAYPSALEAGRRKIGDLLEQRRRTPGNTLFGAQDVEELTQRIDTLKRTQATSIESAAQGIVVDSLVQANRKYGASFPDEFNLSEYEYGNDGTEPPHP